MNQTPQLAFWHASWRRLKLHGKLLPIRLKLIIKVDPRKGGRPWTIQKDREGRKGRFSERG
jgi:hypothetical protein